ncbi:MAG: hypothetical protein ABS76_28510 [Pelagibacterium sp. SCN 64-44]|nr:MAG: hypothetical protein ABS76_28510 [Pelagibacterium sp. SCN 64-44]
MTIIDEIEELRAELRHCHLSAPERREAEERLADLLRARNTSDRLDALVDRQPVDQLPTER